MKLQVKRGEHIGIISDNRKEWFLTDYAILALGAVDVPKGSDSTPDEIGYILTHAECSVCFSENKNQTEKILLIIEKVPSLKKIIVYDIENLDTINSPEGVDIISFNELRLSRNPVGCFQPMYFLGF